MEWLFNLIESEVDKSAIIHNGKTTTYGDLLLKIKSSLVLLSKNGVAAGHKVVVRGDFSADTVAIMIAILELKALFVPISPTSNVELDYLVSVSGSDWLIEFDYENNNFKIGSLTHEASHPLIDNLLSRDLAGIILFSSGSTGVPKAMLYSADTVLNKFKIQRPSTVAIPFLLMDHFGGINTIFALLSSLSTIITVENRKPEVVCRAIERHGVKLLPTTPSFLSLLIAGDGWRNYNLSSVERITYGTEVMSPYVLSKLLTMFPSVTFQQSYGLSEVGVLKTTSKSSGSLYVKLGGHGFETKIVGEELWVRSDYSMEGYLNAPSPFDEDGWMNTQDLVIEEEGFVKILGRTTDIINVGGQKVYPTEIEDVILELPFVQDVAVFGEQNSLLGQIVCAKIKCHSDVQKSYAQLKSELRKHCLEKISSFKVPVKIVFTDLELHSSRQKKIRRAKI